MQPVEEPEPRSTVIVVAGGEIPDGRLRSVVPEGAPVIAADSGVDHALRLCLRVTTVVGDLDSASAEGLRAARNAGAEVVPHPADKDATDLELALLAAAATGPEAIVVLGGHGGRADHHLANLLLLGAPELAATTVTAWMGPALVTVVHHQVQLSGRVGSLVSLLPVHGTAVGVTTSNLAYPLDDEDLPVGTSRGVSNRLVAAPAGVRLRQGVLFAIQPDALSDLVGGPRS